jgi:hypothetical protein
MMRVAVGLPHEGIAGFMDQRNPHREFLYDLEPDQLEMLHDYWKTRARTPYCSSSTSGWMTSRSGTRSNSPLTHNKKHGRGRKGRTRGLADATRHEPRGLPPGRHGPVPWISG